MKVERPCGERGVGGGKDEVDVEGKGDGEGGASDCRAEGRVRA